MTQEWQDDPPTYDQWTEGENEGYWWIKTTIEGEGQFPELFLYEIVRICFTPDRTDGFGKRKGRLTFTIDKKHFYCDDLPKWRGSMQWQPVESPHWDRLL